MSRKKFDNAELLNFVEPSDTIPNESQISGGAFYKKCFGKTSQIVFVEVLHCRRKIKLVEEIWFVKISHYDPCMSIL